MVGSSMAPKWPIPVPLWGIDHQKSNYSLISYTLSVGGCWGQPILLFWKLVDETQNLIPREPTMHHNLIKLLILLPFRADLLCTLQCETPCTYPFFHITNKQKSPNSMYNRQRVQERRSSSARSWARSQNSERSMNGVHFYLGDCKKNEAQKFHERTLWVRSF